MTNTLQKCNRPGCTGTIVDGVCDDCGRAPLGGPSLVKPPASSAAPAQGSGAQAAGPAASQAAAKQALLNTASARTGGAGPGSTRSTLSSSSGTASSSSLSGRTGSTSRRSSTRSSSGSTRRTLGAGMVNLAPLPTIDPLLVIMADPSVPDNKRYCPNCNAKLNHPKGFCPNCGSEYSFVPSLKAGDIVAGQYEVKGAMAFGGLGWIYLGWDTALSRWVVLKGLLNSKDAASAAAAMAERQFLAAVKHPNIVGVYNFVNQGTEGYIVMEYVGGKTLKTLRKERGPLPVAEAIAYIHRILAAFGYLERLNLVYCDFKPDNFMIEEDDVKLIDMGGVRRVDDLGGDVYGTKGYTAPEAAEEPSFVSDLYTVARTLAVLIMDFKFQGAFEYSLPTPEEQPLFAQYDSLYRFLIKATRENPDDRFQSADEMADQLLGVLREITALEQNKPHPAESAYFYGDTLDMRGAEKNEVLGWDTLPLMKPDATDTAAGALLAAGSIPDSKQHLALLERAHKQFPDSLETPLRLALLMLSEGKYADVEKYLIHVAEKDPFDWRVLWVRGLSLLAQQKYPEAVTAFDVVWNELPGELVPKLALALANERAGNIQAAIRLYDIVSRTNPEFTSATFGLARCFSRVKDRAGAVAAYQRVNNSSSRYVEAQMSMTRALVHTEPTAPGEQQLIQASQTLQKLALDTFDLHYLSAQLLLAAVRQVESKAIPANNTAQILGQEMRANSLRYGVERELRACAHLAKTQSEKIALIDEANRERPQTLV